MVDSQDKSSRFSGLRSQDQASDLTRSLFEDILNTASIAIFVIGQDSRVAWMNLRGRSLVDTKRGIVMVNGRLRGETSVQSVEIATLIKQTISPPKATASRRAVQTRSLSRRTHEQPLRLVAVGLSGSGRAANLQDSVSVLFVADLETHGLVNPHLLKKLFDLTPTEAKIAAGLADGSSTDDLARDLGIGLGTARWHVKRAMARTGTRRQGELIRMILLSPLGFLAIP